MGMDRFFRRGVGKWVELTTPWEFQELDYWVDIHQVLDERYFFPDLVSALDFYIDGWKGRRFDAPDADGKVRCAGLGLGYRDNVMHVRSDTDLDDQAKANLRLMIQER